MKGGYRNYGRGSNWTYIPNTSTALTPTQSKPYHQPQTKNLLLPAHTTKPPLLPTPNVAPITNSNVQFWKISPAERKEGLAKGLCSNYDQTYVEGHRCTSRYFLLTIDDNDEVNPEESEPIIKVEYGNELVESEDVSILNSLVGYGSPRSLQLLSKI